MPIRLFSLRHVPEDEADEIRALLTRHGIAFYETPANKWGISAATIWLREDDRLEEAKALIETYQQERAINAREEYERLKSEGKAETLVERLMQRPVQSLFYIALVLLILYLSIKPFLMLGK